MGVRLGGGAQGAGVHRGRLGRVGNRELGYRAEIWGWDTGSWVTGVNGGIFGDGEQLS